MLDIRRIRTDLDGVVADLARKGVEPSEVRQVHELDARQREVGARRDEVRNRIKAISGEVGRLHRDGRGDEAEQLRAESRELGEEEATLAAEADALAQQIRDLLLAIPNTPAAEVLDRMADEGPWYALGDGETYEDMIFATLTSKGLIRCPECGAPVTVCEESLGKLTMEVLGRW